MSLLAALHSFAKLLFAPHFKLGAATGVGIVVAQLLWVVGPLLLQGVAYVVTAFAQWLWRKACSYKDRLLALLNWSAYLTIILLIATQLALPYFEEHPEPVDQLMTWSGVAVHHGWRTLAATWALLDATTELVGNWSQTVRQVLTEQQQQRAQQQAVAVRDAGKKRG